MKRLAIFGCGRHGRVVAELAELNGYEPLFFDDRWEATVSPINGAS